jgi:uncharacterized protein YndB with AHSA1/START domain
MNYIRPKQIELTLSRLIPAEPGEVYDVWLDPKSPGGPWFGSKRVILDPKVDGLFYHLVEHAGMEWAHYGRFLALDRAAKIAHTWISEGTRGLESTVTVTFEPDPEGTRVTLRHAGVPDDDFGRQHKEGWAFMLESIEQRFRKRSKP